MVHPGKHLRDYPKVRLAKANVLDAREVFEAANEWLYQKLAQDIMKEIEEQEAKEARKTKKLK